MSDLPVLYSFRRCPYAMRARMGLLQSSIAVSITEVSLKDKPAAMLEVSPKGTVPVLVLEDGTVIDESLDIMIWALQQHDPEGWLEGDLDLIKMNDGTFKKNLDRYKYPNRYPDEDCSHARKQSAEFLQGLNTLLAQHQFLCGNALTITDITIFPFIRQFAHVDKDWFYTQDWKPLINWLTYHFESERFQKIMEKNLSQLP